MKVEATLQARMVSTRFPGKVMQKIGVTSATELLLKCLNLSKSLDEIIVAVPLGDLDKLLVRYLVALAFNVFQGNETDVLKRYL